ncbi:MAG: pteridine-dependent deoxygenase [Nevskia sp.]
MPTASPRASDDDLPPIRFSYAERLPSADRHLLAAFAYGRGAVVSAPAIAIGLQPRDAAPCYELWQAAGPVRRRRAFGADLAEDGRLLSAVWQLDEAAAGGLEAAAEKVYRGLPALLADTGYAQVVKIWHYFGAINAGEGDDERYRRFCVGRARGLPPELPLPAATAVGLQSPPGALTVLLLAAREPGRRIENPRQVPAYEYPRVYGPASPSFSRAMLMPWGQLFVSGTAAVVGHESRHPDHAAAQLRELVLNLDALVARAEALGGRRLQPSAIKLYLRRAEDFATIDALAAQMFPPGCLRLTVLADICRAELQVEVEALYDAVAGG